MLSFIKKYAKDEFSQNGEDGILQEIIDRLGIEKGTVVEFGAHNGLYCSNSRRLILKEWSAVLIECDDNLYKQLFALYKKASDLSFTKPGHKLYNVTLNHRAVTPQNVNELLPAEIDILSIDVDGMDILIWDAYAGKAKVVVIEINSSLDPMSTVQDYARQGASYSAMYTVGMLKAYMLVGHCGNLIFVREEYRHLFPELHGTHPIRDIDLYFNRSWQKS